MRTLLLSFAALGIAMLSSSTASAQRRGPGGDIGAGFTVGAPSGLTASAYPLRLLSVNATLGTRGFVARSYADLSLTVHSPQLVRTPMMSVRLAAALGAFATWRAPFDDNQPSEAGPMAEPGLFVEPSAFPMQLAVRVPFWLPLTRFDEPLGDKKVFVGVTGGLLYYF